MLVNSIAAGCRPRIGLKMHTVSPGASNQQKSQTFSKLPCTLPSATSGNMISQKKYSEHSAHDLWCASGENYLLVSRYCMMHFECFFSSPFLVDFQKEKAITFPDSAPFTHYVKKITLKLFVVCCYRRGQGKFIHNKVLSSLLIWKGVNMWTINTEIQCHVDKAILIKH